VLLIAEHRVAEMAHQSDARAKAEWPEPILSRTATELLPTRSATTTAVMVFS
jgi:hypothetical protein